MRRVYRSIVICLLAVALVGAAAAIRYPDMVFLNAPQLAFDESEPPAAAPRLWLNYSREYLAALRAEFGLEALVADCRDDYERLQVVTAWVNGLWRHHGSNQPSRGDPATILREAAAGERFRCVEYSIVIAGCLEALGIQARVLGLKTRDVETRPSGAGHVVVEAYLRDLDKWVMADGQWNAIADSGGVPLSAVELQRALATRDRGLAFRGVSGFNEIIYQRWVAPYLYYFDTRVQGEYVMLGPVGAPQPASFQGKTPLTIDFYTHSLRLFYESPE